MHAHFVPLYAISPENSPYNRPNAITRRLSLSMYINVRPNTQIIGIYIYSLFLRQIVFVHVHPCVIIAFLHSSLLLFVPMVLKFNCIFLFVLLPLPGFVFIVQVDLLCILCVSRTQASCIS